MADILTYSISIFVIFVIILVLMDILNRFKGTKKIIEFLEEVMDSVISMA